MKRKNKKPIAVNPTLNMRYNTANNHLIYKEYGRNIQQLVEHAVTIEDDVYRNKFARAIIGLMGEMHPHLRNVEEFKHKLWDQLYRLSNFQLEIDSPYPKPTLEEVLQQPGALPYPQTKLRFKHYGKNVESLVAKAMVMEDSAKRIAFAKVIANYMKMVYSNRNKESISDEIIKNDLILLSEGILDLTQESSLDMPKSPGSGGHRKKKRNDGRGGKGKDHRDRDRDSRDRYSNKRKGHRNDRNDR